MIKFSIIVPVYNTDKYLVECIDSITSQTYQDYEVIIVDDGSRQECAALCDVYKEKEKFKVIHKENGGLVSARKAGALCATGDYIINIDSDDYIRNDYLKTIHDTIADRDVDCIAINYIRFNANDEIEIENSVPDGLYQGEELNVIRSGYLYNKDENRMNSGSLIYGVVAKVVKRDIYKIVQNSIPNEISIGEDTAFTYMLLKMIDSIYISRYNGYYYRENYNSLTHKITEKELAGISCLEDFLINNDCNSVFRNQIYTYVVMRIVNLYSVMAYAENYNSFRAKIKNCLPPNIIEALDNVEKNKWGIGFSIKYFCIKHKLYGIFYLLVKAKYQI